ncbi:hypothetical protein ACP6NG_10890 [Brevibacterium casei]|uniref:hypothetical protein n=1 Tax=Brevibacterium casei TaxID=33889 RepID=UPI003F820A45
MTSTTTTTTEQDSDPQSSRYCALSEEELARIRQAARERAQTLPPMSEEFVKLTRNLLRTGGT